MKVNWVLLRGQVPYGAELVSQIVLELCHDKHEPVGSLLATSVPSHGVGTIMWPMK